MIESKITTALIDEIVDKVIVRYMKYLQSSHNSKNYQSSQNAPSKMLFIINNGVFNIEHEKILCALATTYSIEIMLLNPQHHIPTFSFKHNIVDYNQADNCFDYLNDYKLILLDDLKIGELGRIAQLITNSPTLVLLYQCLKLNKSVYSFSADIAISPENQGLTLQVKQLTDKLQKIGLNLIAPTQHNHILTSKLGSNNAANNYAENAQNIFINKKMLTALDLADYKQDTLTIRADTVLSYGAREYLQQHKIEILRSL